MRNFEDDKPEWFEEWQEQPFVDAISEIAEEAATTVFFYLFEVAYLPTTQRRSYRFLLLGGFLSAASDEYKKLNFTSFGELLPFIATQMKKIYGGLKYQQPYPTGDNPDLIQIIDFFLTGEVASRIYFLFRLKRTFENSSMASLETRREPFETRAFQVFQKIFYACLLTSAKRKWKKTIEELLLDSDKRHWITKEERQLWEQEMIKRKKELEEAKKRDDQV